MEFEEYKSNSHKSRAESAKKEHKVEKDCYRCSKSKEERKFS